MKTLITILVTICAINCMGQDNQGAMFSMPTVRSIIDGGHKFVKFRDDKAYYKLLVPIWCVDNN